MNWNLRHQSDGILYPLLERLTPWMLFNHFRQVHVYNRNVVPSDAPAIIAANHPTAFLDPVVIGSFAPPPLYNMTRGDIFRKPLMRKIFEHIDMFPVYRSRDGFTEADRNDGVFDFCVEKMRQHRVVTLFVEGMHHADKRIATIQKGFARIAFPAYERYQLDTLQIVPVGCSYWTSDQPRDVVYCNYGQPIFIRDYWELYQSQPAAAIKKLCDDIADRLRDLAFHIEDPQDDDLAELLLTLHRSDHAQTIWPHTRYTDTAFRGEKAVLDRLNALDSATKQALKGGAESYFNVLKKNNITDGGLMNPSWMRPVRTLWLILGFLPFVWGWLGHKPLEILAGWVTNNKIKKREFKSSIYLGIEHFGGLFWYFLWIIVGFVSMKPLWIALALLLPICGAWSLVYRDMAREWIEAWRAKRHPQREALLRQRATIQA
jgi:glycerol-3-phosphate O-acyltransferase / dihydroxyacetone phosphate acyltransferase